VKKKNQITLHGYEINKNAYVKGKNKYPWMHGLIFLNFKGKDVILMYLISENKIKFFTFFCIYCIYYNGKGII
jgi:hypothetical protein